MATRDVFSADELAQLRGFPEIGHAELIRFFMLTPADEEFVRRFRDKRNVLGVAVQLCALPWLGFVPEDVPAAPAAAVARLSERLGIPVGELSGYGAREQTRSDHLRDVAAYLGWHQVDRPRWKDLEEFLFARALEHDSPKLLFRLACEYLSSSRLVRPGVVLVLERVAAARKRARKETWQRLEPMLTGFLRAELDGMLVPDPLLGRTRLAWLGTGPTSSTPGAVKGELEKLAYLRGMDAHTLDLSVLPAERRRFLAGLGRRLTAQNLARRDDDRKYPILLTLAAQSAVDVLDEVLLFDQALSGREAAARERLTEVLAERARGGEDRQALLDDILAIVLDPDVADDQVGGRLRRDVGHQRMRTAHDARRERLPRDHGHLALMDASMSYLRQFVPDVLAAVGFAGGPGMDHLLKAVGILARLHAARARKVPDGAPDSFVPARWAGYLEKASKDGNVVAYRHYWELCVLMALRDGLRSGDVHVPGARRYADPASFLLTPQQWGPRRLEYCHLVGKPATAADALALANDELHAALSDLEAQLARGGGKGEVRLGPDSELIIPPLTAEDVPAEASALRDELAALLPRVPIASVLVEIDARTGFTDRLIHAGGKASRPPDLRRNLLYVIIAEATNMGLSAMAESCGVSYDTLAWTAEWYFSAEALEAANAAVVNYHHRLPMTQSFGTGTLSSSDGQKFPVKGKSLTAAHLSRYFARGQGVSTYTHVSDQHSTFDTKVISSTSPESPYALDGILGNQTDLLITEHATDTHGATLANFVLFDLVGLQLSPRIRDLGKITLYRTGPRPDFAARYPASGHLLIRRLNEDLVTGMWDDLLRVAASVKGGHASGALVVGKLCSSRRQQNALACAIKEYGALRRTVFATSLTRPTGGGSGGSSTRARTSTPSSGCSPTPRKGRSAARTTRGRPSRCGA